LLAPVQAHSDNRPAGPTAIRHITLLTDALATGRNPSPTDRDLARFKLIVRITYALGADDQARHHGGHIHVFVTMERYLAFVAHNFRIVSVT
jgi:hypothetical protein